MALSDCYMLRDVQDYLGEKILNVYFYQDTTTTATAEQIVTAWIEDVQPAIINLQTDTVKHLLVDAVNLADAGNFFEQVQDVAGGLAGDTLPAFNAVSFSLRLNTRLLRPGSKRICGLSEPAQVDGEIVDTDVLGFIETARIALKAVIGLGSTTLFHPIVIKRIKYNPNPDDLTHFAYRLPETDEEFVFGDVIEVLTTPHVSHQVSRGNGR